MLGVFALQKSLSWILDFKMVDSCFWSMVSDLKVFPMSPLTRFSPAALVPPLWRTQCELIDLLFINEDSDRMFPTAVENSSVV